MDAYDAMMAADAACSGCGDPVPRTYVFGDHWCPSCSRPRSAVYQLIQWSACDAAHIVAVDPLAALRTLHAARVAVEQITRWVVRDAHDAGASWPSIEDCLHLEAGAACDR